MNPPEASRRSNACERMIISTLKWQLYCLSSHLVEHTNQLCPTDSWWSLADTTN